MSTSNQLSNTFLVYLNLDMSNPSYPPFPDLHHYTLPISSQLASPPTSILAPQTVPDPPYPPPFSPPLVLSFIRGQKGGQQACYDRRKPDGTVYWQCRDKKQYTPACTGRLYTLEKESVKRSSDHNYPPSDREVMKSTAMSKAKYDTSTTTSSNVARAVLDSNPADVKAILPPCRLIAKQNRNYRKNNASEGATMRSNTQQLRTILASGPSCQLSGHSTLRWRRSFSSSGRTSILSAPRT